MDLVGQYQRELEGHQPTKVSLTHSQVQVLSSIVKPSQHPSNTKVKESIRRNVDKPPDHGGNPTTAADRQREQSHLQQQEVKAILRKVNEKLPSREPTATTTRKESDNQKATHARTTPPERKIKIESTSNNHDRHQQAQPDTKMNNHKSKGTDTEQDSEEDKPKKPLNILLLYGDDWTLKTLGILNKFVKTPNLDRMTERGMLFTHNCVTTSICMVSRATLYTGQYASRHQTYTHKSREMYDTWNQTLFPLLHQHGYYTGLMGKWHHPPPPNGRIKSFDKSEFYSGKHYIKLKRNGNNATTKHITEWNELDALQFLDERPKDKLFFLMVSFYAIHAEDFGKENYRPMNASMPLYENATVPTPPTATKEHFDALPYFFRNGKNFGRGRWWGRYNKPTLYQKMMKVSNVAL